MVFRMVSRLKAWVSLNLHSKRKAPFTPVGLIFIVIQQLTLTPIYFPGNASQVSDGAAALLLTRRSVAQRLGLPIIGKFVTAATISVPPRIMGVGPVYAIPRVLDLADLSLNDIDFEISEAFAGQAVFSV